MSQIVDRQNLDFLLHEVVQLGRITAHPRFEGYDRSTIDAVLDTAQAIARDLYLPCAAEIDESEPRFEAGRALTHPSVKPALQAFADAGFFATGVEADLGGLQAPSVLQTALNGMFSCANLSIHNYAMLTLAAGNLLQAFGSEAQKAAFLPPMMAGRWFGTMCLSEPGAGSSLADIATRAVRSTNGGYALTGTKMWISGGDQDISENIVHMVLARLPGAPPGVKGISLFIVPKFRVGADGEPGDWNHVTLSGLNHKMGNRGTTNAILNFGDGGESIGWMVGEPHQGLRYMFHMMNEARIAVGHGATMLGQAGYLHSLGYARTRPQGRKPAAKDPASPPVPIIQHADIKRLLLSQKASVEGALCLILYCASLVDRLSIAESEDAAAGFETLLGLLTPIAKSWPSEFCLEANKHAIQVLGGCGYTRDYPVERFYRDNRLNPIHEGTHAIHGIDLLGRKLRLHDKAALDGFVLAVGATLSAANDIASLAPFAAALGTAVEDARSTVDAVTECGDIERELANATVFLDAFGHVVIAWMWLMQAVSLHRGDGELPDSAFGRGKLRAMRYFFRYELPKTRTAFRLVRALDTTCLEAGEDEF